jgi:hypothetical protein
VEPLAEPLVEPLREPVLEPSSWLESRAEASVTVSWSADQEGTQPTDSARPKATRIGTVNTL